MSKEIELATVVCGCGQDCGGRVRLVWKESSLCHVYPHGGFEYKRFGDVDGAIAWIGAHYLASNWDLQWTVKPTAKEPDWKTEHRAWLVKRLEWTQVRHEAEAARACDLLHGSKEIREEAAVTAASLAKTITHLTSALMVMDGAQIYGSPIWSVGGGGVMADLYCRGATEEDRAEFADEPSSAMGTAVKEPEGEDSE